MNYIPELNFTKAVVDGLVNFIKPTYGPSAKKVIINNGEISVVLDDGVAIAEQYHLKDNKPGDAIIELVKETARKTNSRVGDGTTGSLILLQAILKNIESTDGLDGALKEAKDFLLSKVKKIESEEELVGIAQMAYNDEEVSKMLAGIIWKLGPDASVTLEESPNLVTTSEIKEGLQLDAGYISQYFVTSTENDEAVWEKTPVLVTDRKINGAKELLPLIDGLVAAKIGRLVVFADDFLGDCIPAFVSNKMSNGFQVLPIKAPSYGDRKRALLDDVVSSVGGAIVPKETEDSFAVAHLGYAEKVIVDKETTTIITNETTKESVANRISIIKNQYDKETNEFDRYILSKRMARLGGGVAIIKVGSSTESETKAIKFKIEDAVNATKVALKSGVVLGGGETLALIETSSKVLNEALKVPKQVLIDNGGPLSTVYDPVEVLIASLESAVSICSLLLSSCGIITRDA